MSDQIKHECGIALIRLLKPLEFYLSKYGTTLYGLNKLYLLMEKQHNRGQDGAGIANIKFDMPSGHRYINRSRSNSPTPIKDVFAKAYDPIREVGAAYPERLNDVNWIKNNLDFTGELFLGHVRYGTFGKNSIESCHPFIRNNNWMTRNLVLAGNFNLTNVDELFDNLLALGQHPIETTDTITVLEKIGHFLDEEVEEQFRHFKRLGHVKRDISPLIAERMDLLKILSRASKYWDGGYVMAGLLGHGDAFVLRDPAGIRPAYFYHDDEIVVVASERPVIQTALNVRAENIEEVEPGNALIIRRNGEVGQYECRQKTERKSCSFERIYFSRGTDKDIYQERKKLGKNLVPAILRNIDHDLQNTVFSYIPNTAAVAFRGLVQELLVFINSMRKEKILQAKDHITPEFLDQLFTSIPRVEKIAVKDVKLRTFITEDKERDDLVAHVYDVTYGVVRSGEDSLVVVDDSIVRGTTLKKSIISILDRLEPKKIIIASSAPQIRYPDCYGIDMTRLGDFIAFKATIELLKENHLGKIINEVYNKCKEQEHLPKEEIVNYVKEIYKPFTAEQISAKIAKLVTPANCKSEVVIIYQTIEDLHDACPNDRGDWYFTGNYPTPGGNKVVNKSFINYIEGKNERAY